MIVMTICFSHSVSATAWRFPPIQHATAEHATEESRGRQYQSGFSETFRTSQGQGFGQKQAANHNYNKLASKVWGDEGESSGQHSSNARRHGNIRDLNQDSNHISYYGPPSGRFQTAAERQGETEYEVNMESDSNKKKNWSFGAEHIHKF